MGDFSKAVLIDRKLLAITLGNDQRPVHPQHCPVLGEIGTGFGVIRPAAFVKASLA
jgi:hypothetical protein